MLGVHAVSLCARRPPALTPPDPAPPRVRVVSSHTAGLLQGSSAHLPRRRHLGLDAEPLVYLLDGAHVARPALILCRELLSDLCERCHERRERVAGVCRREEVGQRKEQRGAARAGSRYVPCVLRAAFLPVQSVLRLRTNDVRGGTAAAQLHRDTGQTCGGPVWARCGGARAVTDSVGAHSFSRSSSRGAPSRCGPSTWRPA